MYLKCNEASEPIVPAGNVRNIHFTYLDVALSWKQIKIHHRTLVKGKPQLSG
jgi:hypothetical protein